MDRRNLVGHSPEGRKESDTPEATRKHAMLTAGKASRTQPQEGAWLCPRPPASAAAPYAATRGRSGACKNAEIPSWLVLLSSCPLWAIHLCHSGNFHRRPQ